MKIENLKINGYGKLKNKDIEFCDKINLVNGNNEAGKSTLLSFIYSMFYGANKNKNGKDISTFDKYKPWDGTEFSGKIKYKLDNNESYEVFRDFNKKNPKIYNKNLEEITSIFNNDKSKGINYIFEQTKVDEEIFLNTSIIEQNSVKLNKSEQTTVMQKISNAISSGDDNISFKKSIDKINKKLNSEVGTDRTSEKPINMINAELIKLNNKKNDLLELKLKQINIQEEKKQILKEREIYENKSKLIKMIKNTFEKNNVKYAEINLEKNIIEDTNIKIENLNKNIDELKKEKINKNNKTKSLNLFFSILFIIISIVSFALKFNIYLSIIFIILAILFFTLHIYKVKKVKKTERKRIEKIESKILELEKEIKIVQENENSKLEEIKNTQEKLLIEKNNDKNIIKNEFLNKISDYDIEKLFEYNYNDLLKELEVCDEKLNKLNINITSLEIENKNVNSELETFAEIEEKINLLNIQKDKLISLGKSINLAKECLNEAYNQMKEQISPKFINDLSNVIEKISNGKYKNINFNDIDGLQVELENGDYILADRLSMGTIDQMYFALRINILNEITEEKMPIILDETFVYYDNNRLENILTYLNENVDNQIIIFSCSKREENILNKLNINYKLVEI